MRKLPVSPPETKVATGFSTVALVAVITQMIQYFWPHVNLPPQSTMLLLAGLLGGVASYFAPHTPVIGEIEAVVEQVLQNIDPAPVPLPSQVVGQTLPPIPTQTSVASGAAATYP